MGLWGQVPLKGQGWGSLYNGFEMAASGDSCYSRVSCVKRGPSSYSDNHFLFSLFPSALLR